MQQNHSNMFVLFEYWIYKSGFVTVCVGTAMVKAKYQSVTEIFSIYKCERYCKMDLKLYTKCNNKICHNSNQCKIFQQQQKAHIIFSVDLEA